MTARRLALAWCWGSVCGLAVGWVYGSAVRDLAAFRALRRAEPGPGAPQPPSGHSETPEGGNEPQEGAWRLDQDELHARPDYQEAISAAKCRPWEPGVDLQPYLDKIAENRAQIEERYAWPVTFTAGLDPIPSQRDDEPCPQYSPGGGLPCSVTGTHTAHIFLGSAAPDRKDDADERIE